MDGRAIHDPETGSSANFGECVEHFWLLLRDPLEQVILQAYHVSAGGVRQCKTAYCCLEDVVDTRIHLQQTLEMTVRHFLVCFCKFLQVALDVGRVWKALCYLCRIKRSVSGSTLPREHYAHKYRQIWSSIRVISFSCSSITPP